MTMQWVRHFSEGSASERDLLGGKGANLAEMTRLGLPVPPGFTITTDAFRALRANDSQVPDSLWEETAAALTSVEQTLGREFGNPHCPLLLSVRSGARDSMPGMMDTILNVGLDDFTVEGLASLSGERFAWDSYRRLIQMYGRVVLEVEGELFEEILTRARKDAGVGHDHELDAEQLKAVAEQFKSTIEGHGAHFPHDPWEQLRGAVMAVFRSWDSPRAIAYRRSHDFPEDAGTAVNIQAMVFGNIGAGCASGVAFTRNPNSGAAGLFGEFMINAQGEDVVSGVRTPLSTDEMIDNPLFSQAHSELLDVARKLEQHFTDMQDLEFTVERGKLWMLQTRTGKRTAAAAVRIAVEMASEGLISREIGVRRVRPEDIESLLHPQIDRTQEVMVLAKGMPASPGAASGKAVFTPERAKEMGEAGEAVILVRNETAAEDFPGMERSKGILTARGGMTSHAAVVARGMGLPAVTGCSGIEVDARHGRFWAGDEVVFEGDIITIDGTTGQVIRGEAAMTKPGLGDEARVLLSWADGIRQLGVRTNADTPADAARAVEFGAEGIGLCRTEHMFFAPGRIEAMRRMILAQSDPERIRALADLQVFQTADFAGIFRAMAGRPVTIRLLDPPLHEFLPTTEAEMHELAVEMGIDVSAISHIVESMREVNPMLGLRGVRLGMTFPDVTRMQARAIFAASLTVSSEGVDVHPEIMIPLVSTPEELREQRRLIEEVATDVFSRAGRTVPFQIGTMIEVPRAALVADKIAGFADFFSLGTNDLTQMTFGLSRDDAARFLPSYVEQGVLADDPFQTLDQEGVGQLVQLATERGRLTKPELSVGVCGEHGGDPASIHFCHRAGLDYVSCSPFRVPVARLAAAHATLEARDCPPTAD
ncbi:MAG: pyruvate, phosphate dikinase [Thermomicrobiales bacterium]|nr:pyruvate, phosphate dikinase [Thermomicrobiales bacterium]